MRLFLDPSRVLALGFASAILVGGAILALPMAQRGEPVGVLDAIFTAASAVCVTGLTVVDTGTRFNGFGQAIILLLIQIGGVGITTVSTVVFLLLRQSVSLSSMEAVTGSFFRHRDVAFSTLLRRVLLWTFAIEGCGAVFLFLEESRRLPLAEALWMSVFHAVSAFCNAGFGLRPDNLISDRTNATIILPITALIVLGGLGFSVLTEVADWLRKPTATRRRLSLHSKTALTMTAILIVGGMLAFAVLERKNIFAHASSTDVALTSLLASVTARTAGFSTVDYGQLTAATIYVTIALMLVGGCPGSTAGGIKATTVAVIFALARAGFRGERYPRLFNRGIPSDVTAKAMIVLALAVFAASLAVILLAALEVNETSLPQTSQWSLGLLFEVISALCTVGLTTGITPELAATGKCLLIVLMFIGRLGPLTLAVAISRRKPRPPLRYAEEHLMIG
ncbi:TrkH family potassium uptake protein [Defluviicoccus vanus]|uniref:Potassium transporter n=1 Tax=Defluviicoccus vanus TaxID=111831 RepID=A0A7H1MYW9_9PROT|nr:potassium transporter TrkG [Defluviicoccus vanus]QNT68655.1 potassium transporter [Defluviicoccus vanus]